MTRDSTANHRFLFYAEIQISRLLFRTQHYLTKPDLTY